MRMGRCSMLRMMIVPLGLALMIGPTLAQPRGAPLGPAGPVLRPPALHRSLPAPAPFRHVQGTMPRFDRGVAFRHGRGAIPDIARRRAAFRGWPGAVAGYPPLFPFFPDTETRFVESPAPVATEEDDPFAPPVLVGIARSPTPEPTLYRIEGRRDRPVTRVIRIGDAEPRTRSPRDRYAHAETGALLLVVPLR